LPFLSLASWSRSFRRTVGQLVSTTPWAACRLEVAGCLVDVTPRALAPSRDAPLLAPGAGSRARGRLDQQRHAGLHGNAFREAGPSDGVEVHWPLCRDSLRGGLSTCQDRVPANETYSGAWGECSARVFHSSRQWSSMRDVPTEAQTSQANAGPRLRPVAVSAADLTPCESLYGRPVAPPLAARSRRGRCTSGPALGRYPTRGGST
jgi:hypothetical protein